MNLGIPGMAQEISAYRDKSKAEGGDYLLYEGMLLALNVIVDSCYFYRDQALQKATKASGTQRETELRQVGRCAR